MKDKHITVVLLFVLGAVFIGGAIDQYSPDVCPDPQTQTTTPTPLPTTASLVSGGMTQ